LQEKGYNIIAVKNHWLNPYDPYQGVNVKILSPSEQKFELQFHTRESFDLKSGELHELYEKQRLIADKTSSEWLELNDKMFGLSNDLKIPDDVKRIKQ
jgi:hypothetical protein